MISELKDEEILEYLMTSDFIENYRPDDYKYLLFKFRAFYKILHGKHQNYKIEKEPVIKNLQLSADSLKNQIHDEQVKSAKLQDTIDQLKKPRKLTWKERISGKINS